MEISLRSQFTAGVVFVGAAAVAVTPIAVPDVLPSVQRVTANVQNAAFVDPLATLGASLGLLGQWVFGTQFTDGAQLPLDTGDIVGAPWFLSPDGVIPQLLNGTQLYALTPPAGPFVPIGSVTGMPMLTQVGTNLSNYALAGVGALQGITDATGALLFGLPLAAFTVISDLLNGQTPDFAAIIQDTIITPITNAVTSVIGAVTYVATNVVNNTLSLLTALPTLAIAAATTAVNGLVYTGTQLLNTATTAIGDLATLDLEGAWNTTVEGVLGPTGLIGNLLNLSIGQGVVVPDNPDSPFIPSMRQTLTGATIAGSLAIQTEPPVVTAPTGTLAGRAGGAANARSALSAATATTGDAQTNTATVTQPKPTTATGKTAASAILNAAGIKADADSSTTATATAKTPAASAAVDSKTADTKKGSGR